LKFFTKNQRFLFYHLLIAWALTIFLPNRIKAQDIKINFKHFSVYNGLPNNNTATIFSDSRGFIWISTNDGLVRFNGKDFQSYFHSDSDMQSISSNNTSYVTEDKNGQLLISTSEGVSLFNPLKNKFKTVFSPSKINNTQFNDAVEEITIDSRGHIWVNNLQGLFELDANYTLIKTYLHEIVGNGLFYNVLENTTGKIWINKSGSINLIEQSSNHIYNSANNPANKAIFKYKFKTITKNKKKEIIGISFDDYLMQFDSSGNMLSNLKLQFSNYRYKLLVASDDKIWISTSGEGLFVWDPMKHKMIRYFHQDDNKESICSNVINCVYEDPYKNIWIATDNGLELLYNKPFETKVWSDFGKEKNGNQIMLTGFVKKASTLWVTSWGKGLYKADVYSHKKSNYTCWKRTIDNMLWDIIPVKNTLLLGNYSGVYAFDTNSLKCADFKTIESYPIKRDSIAAFGFFEDRDKNIWISLLEANGIVKYFPNENRFIHYNRKFTDKRNLPFAHYDAITQDSKGRIWMGHNRSKGLACQEYGSEYIKMPMKNGKSLINDYITALLAEGNNLWVGSNSGLYKMNLTNFEAEKITSVEGLPNNNILSLCKDKKGFIWVGTYNGLSRLKIADHSINNFEPEIDIPENEIDRLWFEDSTETLWGCSPHSIFSIKYKDVNLNYTTYAPYVVALNVNGKITHFIPDSIYDIPYNVPYFNIQFSSIFPNMTSKNFYQYKLEGYNKNWISIGTKENAEFTNLPSGSYTFRVKVSSDGIHWRETSFPLKINIVAPFYNTGKFKILLIILLIFSAYLIQRYLFKSKLRRLVYGQKIRNDISQDMHDDLSSALIKINWISEKLKSQALKLTPEELMTNLNKISLTSKEASTRISEIIWSLNPNHSHIEDMLINMRNHINTFFEDSDHNVDIDFPDTIQKKELDPRLIRNLNMILKESLNNIMKHSNAKNVSIIFRPSINNKMYEFMISDDGCGFNEKANNIQGNGINNIRKRAESCHASVEWISTKDKGTTLKISGPMY